MPLPLPPAAMIWEAVTEAVLPPFAAAAVVLGGVVAVFGRRAGVAGAALGLIAGWAAGNAARGVVPWGPDRGRLEWLPWVAAAATLAGLLIRVPRLPAGVGWAAWAAVLAFAVPRLVPDDFLREPWWAVPAFVLLNAAVGFGLMRLCRRDPGAGVPAFAALALFAAGGVVLHAHSARMLDVTTVVGSALLGLATVAAFTRADVGGAMPGAAVFLSGTALAGYHDTYSEVPWPAFALPAVAPLALFAVLLPPLWRLTRWRLRLAQLLVIAVPLIGAVWLAARAEALDFENV